jgi:REP element-mobilizing transposase RayT
LPKALVEALRSEKELNLSGLVRLPEKRPALGGLLAESSLFIREDTWLNKAEFGPKWLTHPAVVGVVMEALHYRDRREYDLSAFCVMANHIHVLFTPLAQPNGSCISLNKIMQSLKRHTARQANLILGRDGTFWQDESYDHVVRDHGEFARILHYVLENPMKAGLLSQWDEWEWTFCKPELLL